MGSRRLGKRGSTTWAKIYERLVHFGASSTEITRNFIRKKENNIKTKKSSKSQNLSNRKNNVLEKRKKFCKGKIIESPMHFPRRYLAPQRANNFEQLFRR